MKLVPGEFAGGVGERHRLQARRFAAEQVVAPVAVEVSYEELGPGALAEVDGLTKAGARVRGTYDITLASSGAEALTRLGSAGSDLVNAVLVDYAMPGMDGMSFVAKQRESQPYLPCLFLTAYAELEVVRSASRQYGVSAVIMKPWIPNCITRPDVGSEISRREYEPGRAALPA